MSYRAQVSPPDPNESSQGTGYLLTTGPPVTHRRLTACKSCQVKSDHVMASSCINDVIESVWMHSTLNPLLARAFHGSRVMVKRTCKNPKHALMERRWLLNLRV